ncbi:PepSY domain-containing protein [Pontibacter qinzhouensis]|uniref:PepSY domain-containing protein n=1 Tax=Pontibacter qinzhouensis TaxID=2603253 RepID=A0A5C8K6H5_9BACT|nr:PepSY-associated TM helix domain-containing protein [Pontibacter qinzhouensis]TXK47422.1 PepSY domain-containing protein [Pontibacter qinzhouensis]
MKNKSLWRKLVTDLHLWLGIGSGLVLFVVCLSGTIYTFRTEIEEFIEADKFRVTVPANAVALSPDALAATLEQELKGKVVAVEIPQDPARPYRFGVTAASPEAKPEGKNKAVAAEAKRGKPAEATAQAAPGGRSRGGRPTTYLVDQYTGTVKGTTETAASEFFMSMMKLHRWLLLEAEPGAVNPGRIIVGVSTIIFTFLVLSGLVLWFPVKLKNWKQGLKVKTSGNWKRTNHDLHNTLGFYSLPLLLIMSLTGLCWSFEWYKDGVSAVLGEEVFKGRREQPLPSDPATATGTTPNLAAFIEKTNTVLPYEGNLRISLPADATGSVVVNKSKAGFFAPAASDKVQLNQYNNEVLKLEKFSDKPLNAQIASSIKPLHLGDIYGTFSKILYFIACLVATSLPVTGTLIWINKLRKKPKQRNRHVKTKTMASSIGS